MKRALRPSLAIAGLALVASIAVACGQAAAPKSNGSTSTVQPVTIEETGSSLLYPLFGFWAPAYHQSLPAVQINTASTGSGTGISSAISGTVQIGASDAYLSPSNVQQAPTLMNIPLAISSQVVSYNVPGLTVPHLNLSGPVLAGIYSGKITKWNDPAITAMNPGVTLPNLTIVPIHRSDSSGDTFIFSQYLSFSTPSWNSTVGYGTGVTFPSVSTALGANGNQGMVTTLTSIKGGIAYVGISYLSSLNQANLAYASLLNKDGNYVLPTSANVQAAAAARAGQTPANEAISLIFAPGANSYPIINYEYAIVNQTQSDANMGKAVKGFLTWAINQGNASSYLSQVSFMPLPAAIKTLSEKQIAKIH